MADTTSTTTPDLRPGESPGGTTMIVDVPKLTSSPSANPPISLRSPRKYNPKLSSSTEFTVPPLEWLEGTWSVTHSTLPMWRKAKNVRITYTIIPSSSPSKPTLLDDEVCSEPTERTLLPQPKSIRGIDTPDGDGAWNWRGKGWLKIASSHWEILGWGERNIGEEGNGEKERWVVTWFAPSMFTPAGLDIYSSRKDGMSDTTFNAVRAALENLEAKEMADLVKTDMQVVAIKY